MSLLRRVRSCPSLPPRPRWQARGLVRAAGCLVAAFVAVSALAPTALAQTPEENDKAAADAMFDALRGRLSGLPGTSVEGLEITAADDFAYTDPVDGSTAQRQGVRIIFGDAARVVFRLSGTGTVGATVRVYLERYEPDPAAQSQDPQAALDQVVRAAEALTGLSTRLGRAEPDVRT